MVRFTLPLLALLALAGSSATWAEDTAAPPAAPATPAAPAPAPAATATPAATAAPAAAPAPADKPKSVEDRLTAVEAVAKAGSDSANELSLNTGDNAWVLVSSALVLLMTLPGLALFYGGLVRRKNVLGTMMQSMAIACIVSIVWALCGYSFAFGPGTHVKMDANGAPVKDDKGVVQMDTGPMTPFFGGTSYCFGAHVLTDPDHKMPTAAKGADGKWVITPAPDGTPPLVPAPYGTYCASINHGSYCLFQLMFAIITPALICGAYAERMKFSAMCIFSTVWLLVVYCPLAHMVWGENGWLNWGSALAKIPAFDFAGGTVVHISSGVAALMCAIFMGKRKGYPETPMPPHSIVLSFIGAALLWVGWFGFNAGSALQANGLAVLAFANTHFATAAAAIGWPLAEWVIRGKPTVLGAISGAVAGLVAITPASGFVTPMGAITLGFIAGVLCFTSTSYLKKLLKYDDSLDAFGVHGVGGMWGAIATGIFFNPDANPNVAGAGANDIYARVLSKDYNVIAGQIEAVIVAVLVSAIGTSIILLILKFTIGLKVTPDQETEGLDVSQHGEEGYTEAA